MKPAVEPFLARALVVALLAATLFGCTHFEALTVAPPGRTASLDARKNEIVLSPGVAFAVKCTTSGGNPCAEGRATIDNPKIAGVYPAHLDNLDWYTRGRSMPTGYVLVGLNPGETVLHIAGEESLHVIVREQGQGETARPAPQRAE